MNTKNYEMAWKINWALLGVLMLTGGVVKFFMMGGAGVAKMLTGLGFPAPALLGWILILAEVGSGLAILAKWNLEKVVWVPIVIILTAILFYWKMPFFAGKVPLQITQTLVHLALASNFWLLGNKKF